ncbi:MAG: ATP-binding cassette domain-containing protein [Dermatophilaceae bacterium]
MRLVARGVSVAIGGRTLLRGVDLDLATGESVALTGPSGSGKTTLLALLGGLLKPTTGHVAVVRDPDDQGDLRDGAGATGPENALSPGEVVTWILQTANVLSDRSCLDNAALGGYADGRNRTQCMAAAAVELAMMGMADRAEEPVRILSGGQLQRVVGARALVSRRPFILADEPTGNLDHQSTREFLDVFMSAVVGRGLVVATHDPHVAARCDRIIHIESARVVAHREGA